MQLILVLETRSSCKSDYRYLKSTIDYFYKQRVFNIKPVFAKCKSELCKQDKKIKEGIEKYSDKSFVVVCADVDDLNDPLNRHIIDYCASKGYYLVWMNQNIEHVYLGKINVASKENESIGFLKRADKFHSDATNLAVNDPLDTPRSSNILCVLDQFLPKK